MMLATMPPSPPTAIEVIQTQGASDVAQFIAVELKNDRFRLRESFTLGSRVADAEADLESIWQECNTENWDGFGAAPVNQETLRQAANFLDVLPLGTPAPEVGAEPDGHLTFEWYNSPRRTLSISVSPEGELHYAALLGARKIYGTEPFFGKIPSNILGLVYQTVST